MFCQNVVWKIVFIPCSIQINYLFLFILIQSTVNFIFFFKNCSIFYFFYQFRIITIFNKLQRSILRKHVHHRGSRRYKLFRFNK